jgi:hypothetical protein
MFAKMEVGDGVKWLSGTADLNVPEEVIEDTEDRKVITRYTPLGVVAAIVPWNFPIQLGKSILPRPKLKKSMLISRNFQPVGRLLQQF